MRVSSSGAGTIPPVQVREYAKSQWSAYISGTAGVERCVLVPPTLDADRNDHRLEAARKHPRRFAVMGQLDLEWIMGRGLSEWIGGKQ